jgi:hypothetical protein
LEKNGQIITTISQQLVGYDEQWSVLEIAAIIKDIKEYIFIIATVMKVFDPTSSTILYLPLRVTMMSKL